mgnify:CR=1 FL=1
MKPGAAKGSLVASRTGRFGAGAQDRAKSEAQRKLDPPLPTTPPEWLRPDAASIWTENLPHLAGRATAADAESYASWCIASANIRALQSATDREGREELRASQRVQVALGRELCLTVVSRARIPATGDEDQTDARQAKIASLVR